MKIFEIFLATWPVRYDDETQEYKFLLGFCTKAVGLGFKTKLQPWSQSCRYSTAILF